METAYLIVKIGRGGAKVIRAGGMEKSVEAPPLYMIFRIRLKEGGNFRI